jgi:hypothetical protein
MAEEGTNLDNVRIILDLERLGELIAHIAVAFAQIREVDLPDFDGEEMRQLAISGWRYCMHMSDRAQFAASVNADLAQLDEVPFVEEPQHKPEFGL